MKSKLLIIFCLLVSSLFGQNKGSITFNVVDANKEQIVGAKLILTSETNPSTIFKGITNSEGICLFENISFGGYIANINMIGFEPISEQVTINKSTITRTIVLGDNQEFEEVKVIGNLVNEGNVPVAVTKISLQKIAEELGSRDLPMLLNGTAGVYATTQGGGDGDARINVRGFDQRNVGVMIDGVPVNDMENGAVYWSNWFGLDAITAQMQVQRGLGATKIAMPSIGGTINIITQGIGNKKGGSFKQEYGTGNFLRSSFSYNTGMTKKGWGLTVSTSYKQGDGWVYGTPSQGFFGY